MNCIRINFNAALGEIVEREALQLLGVERRRRGA